MVTFCTSVGGENVEKSWSQSNHKFLDQIWIWRMHDLIHVVKSLVSSRAAWGFDRIRVTSRKECTHSKSDARCFKCNDKTCDIYASHEKTRTHSRCEGIRLQLSDEIPRASHAKARTHSWSDNLCIQSRPRIPRDTSGSDGLRMHPWPHKSCCYFDKKILPWAEGREGAKIQRKPKTNVR